MTETIDLPGVAAKDAGTDAEQGIRQVAEGAAASGVPVTIADRLKRQHQRVLAASVEEFPVPGWGGNLVARVHVIEDREDFVATARAADADAAFVARVTTQLLMTNEDGELIELADERGPIGFDDRFAAMLDIKAKSASETVTITLGRNPAAVTKFAERLLKWMERAEAVAEGGLGPS